MDYLLLIARSMNKLVLGCYDLIFPFLVAKLFKFRDVIGLIFYWELLSIYVEFHCQISFSIGILVDFVMDMS